MIKLVLIISILAAAAHAASLPTHLDPQAAPPPAGTDTDITVSETSLSKSPYEKLKETLGITYFSYFYGPGVHPDKYLYNPNQLGLPQNDGTYFQNQVSFRYKFSKTLALDLQTRFNIILNNNSQNPEFSPFRWQTPRIGVSGKLLTGDDWTLVGAVNTDFPYFFPVPFSGYQSVQRRVILTPGMFASFKYEPRNSRWTVFSVISPRFLIYEDRNAAEPQFVNAGFIPQNKAEFILGLQPTINYKLSKVTRLTLGTTIDYRKQVVSSWNIFDASLITNGDSPAWRLDALPINLGVTFDVASAFTIFPFITTYPIAVQRMNARTGAQATLLETTSIGMWLYGTLF